MGQYKTTIEVDGIEDVPVTVHYSATAPSKGATDGKYGPKIEPDDPGGIEIESVTLDEDGREMMLTGASEISITEEIGEWLADLRDQSEPEWLSRDIDVLADEPDVIDPFMTPLMPVRQEDLNCDKLLHDRLMSGERRDA